MHLQCCRHSEREGAPLRENSVRCIFVITTAAHIIMDCDDLGV